MRRITRLFPGEYPPGSILNQSTASFCGSCTPAPSLDILDGQPHAPQDHVEGWKIRV